MKLCAGLCKDANGRALLSRMMKRRQRPQHRSGCRPLRQQASITYAEVRERMRQFKAQPVVSPPVRKKVFEVSEEDLDSTRPLKMLPPK
jgi:hypothetical protein